MGDLEARLADLSDEDRSLVESWLFEFDRGWHKEHLSEAVGKLPPPGSPLRLAALQELVKIDMERQWEHGRQVSVEGYLRAYPELGTIDTAPADLILKEYEIRRATGDSPKETTFFKRFPKQADQLRHMLKEAQRGETQSRDAVHSAETIHGDSPHSALAPGRAALGAGLRTPPPKPELPEQFGRYRIRKCLGQGGMGSVYLAHDTQLGRDVALKVPQLSAADGPEVRLRFEREARAAATLRHPHICPVYDVGQVDNVPYLTMAYIEGQPLTAYVKRSRGLTAKQLAVLVRKLALALEEAHAKGIVHRDLKSSNVMIDKRGEPVIMDFGLALRQGDARITTTGSTVGTLAYMAPEQVEGDTAKMGAACDIYSLGVILYELLCGHLPFEGPYHAVGARILTEEPPPPSAYRPGVDSELEAICLKAMAKQAQERYATMAEMAASLAAYLRGALPRTPKLARPRRRLPLPWLAGMAAALMAAVIAGIVLFWRTPVTIETDGPSVRQALNDIDPVSSRVPVDQKDVKAAPQERKPQAVEAKLRSEYKNSLGMEFVLVPKGKSWLGGGGGIPGDNEVSILYDFYLAKYEVTQEEWEKVTRNNPSYFSRTGRGKDAVKEIPDAELKRLPVESISWNDAQLFLVKLSELDKQQGWGYRLPTQREWEYACRGGPLTDRFQSAYHFYFHRPVDRLGLDLANVRSFVRNKGAQSRTCKVGSYPPNPLGLYDMHGNVCEWCDDEIPADPNDPKMTPRHVRRGGSRSSDARNCTASYRDALSDSTIGSSGNGLRVARVPCGQINKVPVSATKSASDTTGAVRRAVRRIPRLKPTVRPNTDPEKEPKGAARQDAPLSPKKLTDNPGTRTDGQESSTSPGSVTPVRTKRSSSVPPPDKPR
jgi:eukaryotic-like serine/threonine-protein kinase